MSTGTIPQPNVHHLEQERQRIGRLLDEMARLCEAEIPSGGFFAELLKRLLDALQAPAGAIWLRSSQGNIRLEYQINLQLVHLDKSDQARQSHEALLRLAFTEPKPLHLPPNSGVGTPQEGQAAPGNPSDFMLLLVPILHNDQVEGVIEVWQNANRPSNAVPGFLQYMSLMAELATRYLRNQRLSSLANQQQLWTQLEVFARQIHASLNPIEVSYLIANEGKRLIECDRVSVAVRYGSKTSIDAISGADVVEKRSNLVQRMRALCDAVLKWGEKLVYKGAKDEGLPPKVSHALDEYLQESQSRLLVIHPLRDDREGTNTRKPPRSALVMERFESPVEPEQMLGRMEVISRHSTSALYNAVEHRRIPLRFLWAPLARIQEGLGGKTKAIMALILIALTGFFSAMYLLPYPLKMESSGQLLPRIRRFMYSPTTGIVREFTVVPGEDVVEGRTLATLSDKTLEGELLKMDAEIKKAADACKASEDQIKTAPFTDRAKILGQIEEYNQARRGKLKEREALINRTDADPQRPGLFFLKAPSINTDEVREIDAAHHGNHKREWTVLNGTFREDWVNKEARPSDPLLRLGAKDGPWEIELKIPQKHIGQVLKAFEAVRKEKEQLRQQVEQLRQQIAKMGKDAPDSERQALQARLQKLQQQKPDEPAVLDVDFLLRSDPTRTFKGKLYRTKVAPEAVPNKEESSEAEPVVFAVVSVDDPSIDPAYRLPPELFLSGAEVHAKIRCGNHCMGYSLFYGVWEFLYEKVIFFFF